MTALSININKIALLRNQRENDVIDLADYAVQALEAGADGITVHPRPDERHVRFDDLSVLAEVIKTYRQKRPVELNVEGYPSEAFLEHVLKIAPDQVTLVPDPPEAKTSEFGWNVVQNAAFLTEVIGRLKAQGCRVSLFLDPDSSQLSPAAEVGADCVELHTGDFAQAYVQGRAQDEVHRYVQVALLARSYGLKVNAGHDLNKSNLKFLTSHIPWLHEVSIGHALIADCLSMGMVNCVRAYKGKMRRSMIQAAKSA